MEKLLRILRNALFLIMHWSPFIAVVSRSDTRKREVEDYVLMMLKKKCCMYWLVKCVHVNDTFTIVSGSIVLTPSKYKKQRSFRWHASNQENSRALWAWHVSQVSTPKMPCYKIELCGRDTCPRWAKLSVSFNLRFVGLSVCLRVWTLDFDVFLRPV